MDININIDLKAVENDPVREFAEKLSAQFDHLMYVTGDEVKNRIANLLNERTGGAEK